MVSGLFSSESEVAGRRPDSFSTNPRSVRRHRISRPAAIVQLHRGRSLNRLFWLGAGTVGKPPLLSPPVRLPPRRRPARQPLHPPCGRAIGQPKPNTRPPAGPTTAGRAYNHGPGLTPLSRARRLLAQTLGFVVVMGRFEIFSERAQDLREVVVRGNQVGAQSDRCLQRHDRLRIFPQRAERHADIPVQIRVVGREPQRALKSRERFVPSPRRRQRVPQHRVRRGGRRIETRHVFKLDNRFRQTSRPSKRRTQIAAVFD